MFLSCMYVVKIELYQSHTMYLIVCFTNGFLDPIKIALSTKSMHSKCIIKAKHTIINTHLITDCIPSTSMFS